MARMNGRARGSHIQTRPHTRTPGREDARTQGHQDTSFALSLGQTIEDLLPLGAFFGTANVQIRAEIYSQQKVV